MPSICANSGLPPTGIEAAKTSPVFASKTVESLLRPLKVRNAWDDGLIDDGVGVRAGFDFAENLQRLQIENRDVVIRAVAGKAAAEVVRDGDAVDAVGVRNGADDFVGGGVDDFGLGGMRNVEPVVRAVHENVIPAAGAADLDLAHDFVSRAARRSRPR